MKVRPQCRQALQRPWSEDRQDAYHFAGGAYCSGAHFPLASFIIDAILGKI